MAALARASACRFCSRGIQLNRTAVNRPTCSTTSLESIRTSTSAAPSSAAAVNPAIRPWYSATLLVAVPSDSERSASTSPVSGSRTTAP
jgi:hypothetical protein